MWKSLLSTVSVAAVLGLLAHAPSAGQPPDQPDPKAEKPALGDRDELTVQNQRFLKIKNDTKETLTVFVQYRTYRDDAWKWLPANPAESTDALSFEIPAGGELEVKHDDVPVAASRVRIWALSDTKKWLKYKTKDCWLVPERNEDGDHIYLAESIETFTFVFTDSPDQKPIPADSDVSGETCPPTEGENIPPPPEEIPWDDVTPEGVPAGGIPLVRDLAVLPVQVTGSNAVIRVKNLGHLNLNVGRRLIVRKLVPGAPEHDMGPIGPLFHFGVKTFPVVGLGPGKYVAYISPGDQPPFHLNDRKFFSIAATTYPDLAVLPVVVIAGKAHVKVKNVGTAPAPPGQHLKIVKSGGTPVDYGPVGALPVNGVKTFPPVALAAGSYKAFLSPGDPPPHHFNDAKNFVVTAKTFVDLAVLPVLIAGGKVTIKVKNVGTQAAPPGRHLKVQKKGSAAVDHGPIGALPVGAVKTFPAFALAPGSYKAFLSPGDDAAHDDNDAQHFSIADKSYVDLRVLPVTVSAGNVHVKVKNVGTKAAPAGRHLMVKKLKAGAKPIDRGPVGALPVNGVKSFAPFKLAPGTYRAYISPGDDPAHDGNDFDDFTVPGAPADLAALGPVKSGLLKIKATIKNNGPGEYTPGVRTWHLEKKIGPKWIAVPTKGSHVIPHLNPGESVTIEAPFGGPGTYRIRISPHDANPANDEQSNKLVANDSGIYRGTDGGSLFTPARAGRTTDLIAGHTRIT